MRWLPALFLVVVFVVPLFIGGLCLVAVSTFTLDRGFYAELLADDRLFDLPDAFSTATWDEPFPGLSAFPPAMGKLALRELLPPAYLRNQALRVIDQVFTYLEGRGSMDLSLDLSPVKRSLAADGGRRFALALAKELPACSGSAVLPGRGTIPACRPRNWTVEQTAQFIEASLPVVLRSMPDQVAITRPIPLPWRGFSVPVLLIASAALLLVLGIGAWFGAAFAGSSERRGRLLWLGSSLLVPAVVVLLFGIATVMPFSWGWARYGIAMADISLSGFGNGFADALLGTAQAAMQRVATGFLITGGIASGIGIGLLVWGLTTPGTGRGAQKA